MAYSKQVIIIKTKVTDVQQIKTMVSPIVDFTNKHDVSFKIYFNESNDLTSSCEANGCTSAYCKGMVAEVKQMLKDTFKCKLDTILYVY